MGVDEGGLQVIDIEVIILRYGAYSPVVLIVALVVFVIPIILHLWYIHES